MDAQSVLRNYRGTLHAVACFIPCTPYSECTHTSASVVMGSVFKLGTGTGQRVTWYGIFACCTTHALTYSVHTQNTLPSDSTQLGAFPKAFQLTCSSNTRICCSALPVLDQFSPHCYTDDSLSPSFALQRPQAFPQLRST